MMDKIWILTEEKPKASVILQIIEAYCADFHDSICEKKTIKIRPQFEDGIFKFCYAVEGFRVAGAQGIWIKIVSGSSSFIDFLLFKQENPPSENRYDKPLMAIEETKTSDRESRNTGVYQRGAKFVFFEAFYTDVKLYMLYNDELCTREVTKPSDTSIFGTNILLTLGVKIIGKDVSRWFRKFNNVDDIISFKAGMRKPPAGNTPIEIIETGSGILISGRLDKPRAEGKIAHDPNIGALSMISKCLRVLGWAGEIVIIRHQVDPRYISRTRGNKFIYICQLLNLQMQGLILPKNATLPEAYWHYEMSSEKVASILLHVQAEYCGLQEVYQNHAGCERGYFRAPIGRPIPLPKKDSHGNKLYLPDLVLWDRESNTIVLVEGKKLDTLAAGLDEIQNYDSIEEEYIKPRFSDCDVVRGVSIFGGDSCSIPDSGVIFYLNCNGKVFVADDAPACIKRIFSIV